jgi:outer membrane protein assembly factor BamE (lipoprotein component of BamABCDE complex)
VRFFHPIIVALPLLVSGCGVFHIFDSTNVRRGSIVPADALAELTPGTSSRADAISLLGSPTAHATFDDNSWIYIGQITRTRIARTPGVRMQEVVVLHFDPNGTLRAIDRHGLSDAQNIAMSAGATPSPGSEASFMQQLLGNVGRFTPAGLPGTNNNTAGGSGGRSGNSLP